PLGQTSRRPPEPRPPRPQSRDCSQTRSVRASTRRSSRRASPRSVCPPSSAPHPLSFFSGRVLLPFCQPPPHHRPFVSAAFLFLLLPAPSFPRWPACQHPWLVWQ